MVAALMREKYRFLLHFRTSQADGVSPANEVSNLKIGIMPEPRILNASRTHKGTWIKCRDDSE